MDRSIPRTILWSCIRPFQLLALEPMCLNLCVISSLLLGILYLFFGAFPLVFRTNHGMTQAQAGLTFLGLLVGMLFGIATDPLWRAQYRRMVRRAEQAGGEKGATEPEYRLPPTILGAIVVPIGLFGESSLLFLCSRYRVPPSETGCLFHSSLLALFSR